ncbi:MAG: glutathione S-transferase family protein [Pseudomonadota bacterium]
MYVLHYAPDNASMIVRLSLDMLGVPFETALVDRRAGAQRSAAYLALNPNGLIPVLETPEGPLFETGAILTWLVDTHGGIGPSHGAAARGAWLKWLFYVSNTLHPALRQTFYADRYIAPDAAAALRAGLAPHITTAFAQLNRIAAEGAILGSGTGALDAYIAACLRWRTLYPLGDAVGLTLADTPALARMCARLEATEACARLIKAEGLGPHPFTAPAYPEPPEGTAT